MQNNMFFWIKNRFLVKSIHKQLLRTIRKFQPNYIIDSTLDPQIKILSFTTYFLFLQLKMPNIASTIDLLEKNQIIKAYLEIMQNDKELEKTKLVIAKIKLSSDINNEQILSPLIPIESLIKLINLLLDNVKISLSTENMIKMFNLITKLFLINYYTPQFRLMASDNMSNEYQQNLDFVLLQTKLLAEIHRILRIMMPNNINSLVIFINYLLKPLKK